MNKINIADVSVEHRVSPQGRFELHRQHVSLALGGIKDRGPWGGGHPFDIELTKIPAGKRNFPMHSHAAQTEFYIILSGTGLLHQQTGEPLPLRAGDHLMCHPGDAHQIENTGIEILTYYVITDHHPADVGTYTRTGKRWLHPERRVVTVEDAEYYAEEE